MGGRRGVPGGRWNKVAVGRVGGGDHVGEKIVKGTERDESGKQEMGEDRDGERRGGIMRGKEVENDSPSLQTTP